MSRLKMLKDRHVGERCVLVANGPSLKDMNLDFLKTEVTIGLNKIFLGFRKFKFYPRYYISINRKVIEQSAREIRSLHCVKFLGSHGNNTLIVEDALTHIINTSDQLPRFSKDLTQGVHEGWTVTHAALQVAYYLGFKQVIIIGMDHRFQYSGTPNQSSIMQSKDQNHFSTDYFKEGQSWDNPDLEQSEVSYQAAKKVFEDDGREILDATLNGGCNIFKKVNYKEVFEI